LGFSKIKRNFVKNFKKQRIVKEVTVGIDIGGTNTVIGFITKEGNCEQLHSFKTKDYSLLTDYLNALSNKIEQITSENNYKLNGIGVGAPNGNHLLGTVSNAPNLPWKEEIPVVEYLNEQFLVKVKLTNDANAAAIGEKIYGGAKKMNDFIVITLGTGVGSGIFSNGKILYGNQSLAGEIGHVIVNAGSKRLCGCGRYGCLETYCSAKGIVNTAEIKIKEKKTETSLKTLKEITAKAIYEHALLGDKCANEIFDETAEVLALEMANAVCFTNPEAIFVTGGLTKSNGILFDSLQMHFDKHLLNIYQKKVKIMRSQLPDNIAAVLGAAALVHE
jgi:glucokinase